MPGIWRKECLEPYAMQLATGQKTVEGRIYWKHWAAMQVGDILEIQAIPTKQTTAYHIIALDCAPTFADLWAKHGTQLLPNATCLADVAHTYYTECRYTREDELEHGVIGLTLQRIQPLDTDYGT